MAERGKGFPRLSLSGAVKIIDTASKFGKTWPKEQFAGFGSQSGAGSAKSGAFAVRVSSLRDYGLITSSKDSISITDLGTKIAKPVVESERDEAIKQAFMNVDAFRHLFEGLEQDTPLPMDQVAQYAVFTLGVSRESKDKFINAFIDSGRLIGLVEYDKQAATLTLLKNSASSPLSEDSKEEEVVADDLAQNDQSSSLVHQTPVIIGRAPTASSTPLAEQGVNYAGSGWNLTVLLKTSRRINPETRKKVRDLLEQADELSDILHSTDESGAEL